jgi:predicted RNA-binding protein
VCLLKVYLDKGSGRQLVATEVAFVSIEDGGFKFRDILNEELAFLKDVSVSFIDTVNSVLLLKSRS